ncbi:hypothetical protein PC117_g6880 [Phytophthora cactorum]|uniref:Uncharacterized protein n=1 Tax=Phytophthora cactorum TaxID=29920 RepID=A0A8T1E7Z7_9STRA|nr:hypothetical protein PC117_g6880 [Phytophthora cactorum]
MTLETILLLQYNRSMWDASAVAQAIENNRRKRRTEGAEGGIVDIGLKGGARREGSQGNPPSRFECACPISSIPPFARR